MSYESTDDQSACVQPQTAIPCESGTYRHVELFKQEENVLGLFNTREHSNRLFGQHARFKRIYRAFLVRCLYRPTGLKTMSVDDQLCAVLLPVAQNSSLLGRRGHQS